MASPRTEVTSVRPFLITLCVACGLIAGCDRAPEASVSIGAGPPFDPIAFFEGHTHSQGVIENRSGAPTERVVTDSHGVRQGDGRLTMVQRLSFQHGTTQERAWTLWRSGANRFDATANDMIGTAKGLADGDIFHWQWELARSPGNWLMNVSMNQWMYRMDDGSVTIRTTVSKFGFIVAEVTEQFVRDGTSAMAADEGSGPKLRKNALAMKQDMNATGR